MYFIILVLIVSLRSTDFINTFVHCCFSLPMISYNVPKHFINITINWQWYCYDYFVIAQYPSYDKHICTLLFIISIGILKCIVLTITYDWQ